MKEIEQLIEAVSTLRGAQKALAAKKAGDPALAKAVMDVTQGIDAALDAAAAYVKNPRQQVYAALDSERAYQNSKWRRPDSTDPAGHNPHTITEWLSYMQFYVNEGLKVQTLSFEEGAGLDFLRKVAALGVAGMEQHGAQRREGF